MAEKVTVITIPDQRDSELYVAEQCVQWIREMRRPEQKRIAAYLHDRFGGDQP
jgi:hypothetical protein